MIRAQPAAKSVLYTLTMPSDEFKSLEKDNKKQHFDGLIRVAVTGLSKITLYLQT